MKPVLLAAALLLAAAFPAFAQQDQRQPWTTSHLTGSPEPPPPYRLDRVFPKLKFDHPLEIVRIPGSERFAIIEHHQEHLGRIFTFPGDPDCAKPDLFLDLPREIRGWEKTADCKGVGAAYGIAFPPDFEKNRTCYVCYVLEHKVKGKNLPLGSRISRFTVTRTDPPRADPDSEVILLEWLEGGHNGCCLRFGPDGFLYISTGDGTAPNPPDALRTGQDLSDLLSSILRIDVDRAENGKPYAIPRDNPFLATPGARPEIWAYGFRNPWRMDFDPATGNLWVGDVGWERWEMLFRVVRGGNYGWSVMEGPNPVNPAGKRGPTPILPAAMAIEHPEAASITGGRVYRGSRLPELKGKYVFADFEMFHVFGARCEGDTLSERQELARTEERVVAFAEDKDGELLLLDYLGGGIHRLVPNDRGRHNPDFPRKLSETGLFQSLTEGTPAPGVVPYSVNASQWLDHATAERYVALPGTSSVAVQWGRPTFPKDMVLAKTLSLEMERGKAGSRRRLETQVLHYDGRDWQGYSYAWSDDQKDALLVGPAGAEKALVVADAGAPGGRREQKWTYFARAACAGCHTVSWPRFLTSFNDPQLDRGGQVERLRAMGLIAATSKDSGLSLAGGPGETKKLCDPGDAAAELDARARSYLHVNCAVCHRPGGGTSSMLDLRRDRSLQETFALGVPPALGTFGLDGAAILAPGDPSGSVLFYRMAKLGHGRMPHVGSTLVDEAGLALIGRWIEGLPGGKDPKPCATREALDRMRAVDGGRLAPEARQEAVRQGISHSDDAVRGLFERFVPADQRPKRLGTKIQPAQILPLKGDAERGRLLFFESASLQCRNCHAVAGRGDSYGPDLSKIAAKLSREKLLESILEPSKDIDPKFAGYIVQTDQGAVYSGLLLEKSAEAVVLKDAQKNVIRLKAAAVTQMAAQKTSIMPEFLLQSLTASEAADLIEFLSSLR
ncbi:MAG: PQQ-dependent sugar dehydrogenase [Planctomycetes bacterium]|nr:PQQ-dependent sugar dehydrogenase [Planctomycetota bacterium]